MEHQHLKKKHCGWKTRNNEQKRFYSKQRNIFLRISGRAPPLQNKNTGWFVDFWTAHPSFSPSFLSGNCKKSEKHLSTLPAFTPPTLPAATSNEPKALVFHSSRPRFSTAVVSLRLALWSSHDRHKRSLQEQPIKQVLIFSLVITKLIFSSPLHHGRLVHHRVSELHRPLFPILRLATSCRQTKSVIVTPFRHRRLLGNRVSLDVSRHQCSNVSMVSLPLRRVTPTVAVKPRFTFIVATVASLRALGQLCTAVAGAAVLLHTGTALLVDVLAIVLVFPIVLPRSFFHTATLPWCSGTTTNGLSNFNHTENTWAVFK